ncbi:MAG: putative addiction module antidote protein [Nitrospinae bacterium]|nr:putative addiction module antidote protein [Nitrospinota bacterium]
MKKPFGTFDKYLKRTLKNKSDALAYLKAAMADDDQRVFLMAIKDVMEARGITMAGLARLTGMSREHLYQALSLNGNPSWMNINKIIAAIGFRLEVSQNAPRLKKAS